MIMFGKESDEEKEEAIHYLTIPSPSRSINTTDFRYLVKDLLN
jgi:hypothetical protein